MQKNLYILVVSIISALTLYSCSKDYNCRCEYTRAGINYSIDSTVTEGSKKQARKACNNAASAVIGTGTVHCKIN